MNDVLAQLAEANPVHAAELAPLELPAVVNRRPRRLALAAAVVAGAIAASLIGVFAFGGSPKQQDAGLRSLGPAITLEHPLPHPDAKEITLSDATKVLGAPIVLPDNSLASASDVGAVWTQSTGPVVDVSVTFPRSRLIVNYERPVPYPQPVPEMYETEAKQSPDSMSVIDLDGVPALATLQNSDQLHQNFGAIEFVENGTAVSVLGHYETATLQSVAQSIVDRSGPMKPTDESADPVFPPPEVPISLADAPAALGAPVVLPDTPLVSPSDVGSVTKECPGPWDKTCAITVKFPEQAVSIGYTLGGYSDPVPVYESEEPRGQVVYLSGIPALLIPQDPNDTSGTATYMEFQLGGTTIALVGRHYDGPTVQAIAQSIVDRSK